MKKAVAFAKTHPRELVATIVVAAFFMYFWINGPIMQQLELLSIEHIETRYSKPVFVGTEGVNTGFTTFSTISDGEESGFGYGLILDRKPKRQHFGLLADAQNNPGLSQEVASNLLEHAKKFSVDSNRVRLMPAAEMYFATISDASGQVEKLYLESTGVIEDIRGYAGPVHVGVMLDKDGRITDVYHISSRETESYLQQIKNAGYYEQYGETHLTQGAQEVDAVSGATLTSEAMAETVTALVQTGMPEPLVNYAEASELNPFSVTALLDRIWMIHLGVIFLMFFFAMQKWRKKSKKSILALSILSVIYLGFFLNNSFTYISFLHPFLGTSLSSLVGLYALMVLLGAIWGKNAYCKYVCPFGNIQRLIIHFNPVKTSRKFFLSNKWIKRIRGALTVILLTGILLGLRNWSNYEIFPDLFGWSTVSVWLVVAVLTVLTTMIYPMIWCRLLCPTGSILDGIADLMNYNKKLIPRIPWKLSIKMK